MRSLALQVDIRSAFELLDKNGNGKIDKEEILNVVVGCSSLLHHLITSPHDSRHMHPAPAPPLVLTSFPCERAFTSLCVAV